jgi:hypothetical protein
MNVCQPCVGCVSPCGWTVDGSVSELRGLWTSAVLCRNHEQVRRLTVSCPHPYPHRFCVTNGVTGTEVFQRILAGEPSARPGSGAEGRCAVPDSRRYYVRQDPFMPASRQRQSRSEVGNPKPPRESRLQPARRRSVSGAGVNGGANRTGASALGALTDSGGEFLHVIENFAPLGHLAADLLFGIHHGGVVAAKRLPDLGQ